MHEESSSAKETTGVILAGGKGSRMGGLDKGLQNYRGGPLALHAMMRLQPQVGPLMINANRNLAAYESFGVPVWPDSTPDHAGPLAGMLTALEHAETPWIVTVPCDSPAFPDDLVARLHEGAERAGVQVAMAAVRDGQDRQRTQPVFCLIHVECMESLAAFIRSGGRKIDGWTETLPHAVVDFPDERAFMNINTLEELQQAARTAA